MGGEREREREQIKLHNIWLRRTASIVLVGLKCLYTSIKPEKERLVGPLRLSLKEPVEKGPPMVLIDIDVTWELGDRWACGLAW